MNVKFIKTVIPAFLFILAPLCHADQGPENTAKLHLEAFLRCDTRLLVATYAPKVTLMPGHELLKERYGLAGKDARSKKLEAESERIIEALEKAAEDNPQRDEAEIKELLESLKYEQIELEDGKLKLDGEEHELEVAIEDGDVIYKVTHDEHMDFLLLHLRKIDGIWRVVSEYID